jgi:hypothetical protein
MCDLEQRPASEPSPLQAYRDAQVRVPIYDSSGSAARFAQDRWPCCGFKDPSPDRCLSMQFAEVFVVKLPGRFSVNSLMGYPTDWPRRGDCASRAGSTDSARKPDGHDGAVQRPRRRKRAAAVCRQACRRLGRYQLGRRFGEPSEMEARHRLPLAGAPESHPLWYRTHHPD